MDAYVCCNVVQKFINKGKRSGVKTHTDKMMEQVGDCHRVYVRSDHHRI